MPTLAPLLDRLQSLTPEAIASLSDDDLVAVTAQLVSLQSQDRQTNQLRYYKPVSARARQIHLSTARTIGVGGGNGSSKTDTSLVEMVIRATGQIPLSLQESYPREKLRGPINCRIVVESLTTTLFPIILPKLDGRRWQGVDQAGGARGHWGWIPQDCLIDGLWEKSWKAHERILRLYYRDPDHHDRIHGESTIQFMSYDQDPSDFASGDFHFILHDEPPKEAIWVENMARTMRVDGTMFLAMTWPDDPTIAVDWMLDRLYYPAQPGPQHDPTILWVNLDTTENMNLNQTAIARVAGQMSVTERSTRIFGQPITLSNRVHPLFTDEMRTWCFVCQELAILDEAGACGRCGESDVTRFQHVVPCVANHQNPVIQVLDPHPRKPHMLLWLQVTPDDDLEQIAELEVDDVPAVVWSQVQDLEADYGWTTVTRLMDPNMGRSASGTDRHITWQDAFDQAGMRIDLADDGEVGRRLLNDYLKPDPHTREPRYRCDPRCVKTIYQLKRYCWDDFKRNAEKGQKQRAKQKHDDFPTMLKYAMNSNPSFRGLAQMGQSFQRIGTRHNGY
jgi:phage terminase large subunit-like protein